MGAVTLAVAVAAATGAAGDRAFLRLHVNEVEHGDVLVVLRDGDVLCHPQELEAAGLRDLGGARELRDGVEWVSLKSLSPGVSFRLDETSASLFLQALPQHLARTRLDFGTRNRPRDLVLSSTTSAFANYSLQLATGAVPAGFFEAGASTGSLLLLSALSVRPGVGAVRGLSSLTWDDPAGLRRLTFGDAFATSGPLGGALALGGISLTREFALDPYFVSAPAMQLSGVAATPSRVQIYVDGRLTRDEALAPGSFQLENLPGYGSGSSTRIVVRDAFGRTQEFTGTLRSGAGLLAAGLTDYAVQLGLRRLDFSTASFSYGAPVLMTRGRLGLNDGLTAGARIEAAPGFASLGPSLTLGLPHGSLDLAGAASISEGKTGTAASLTWGLSTRAAGLAAQAIWNSREYANASLGAGQDRAVLQLRLSASTSVASRLSLTAGAAQSRMRDAGLSQSLFGSATLQLPASVNVFANVNLDRTPSGAGASFFAGVNVALGPGSSGSITAQRSGQSGSAAIDLRKSQPVGNGVAWSLHGQAGTGAAGQGDVQLYGDHGVGELRYARSAAGADWTASVSGALVAIGGGLHASRPIQDSYALIQAPGLAGVRGELENQEIGRTDASGELLLPRLLPYYGNQIGINAADVPFDRSLGATRRVVGAPVRGGAVVRFEAARVQAFLGNVRLVSRGQPIVPAAGDLYLRRGREEAHFALGMGGEFYLEDIAGGRWQATVAFGGERCTFDLELPASSEMLTQLPPLSCALLVAGRLETKGVVSGRLFLDRNGNGAWDLGEPSIEGVRIRAGGKEGLTDREGRYSLREVPAGPVDVRVASEDLPAGFELAEVPVVHLEPGTEQAADLRLRAPRPQQRVGDVRQVTLKDGRADLYDLFGLVVRKPASRSARLLPRLLGELDDAPDLRLLVVGRGPDFAVAFERARGTARSLGLRVPGSRVVWTVEERSGPAEVEISLVRVRGAEGWATWPVQARKGALVAR